MGPSAPTRKRRGGERGGKRANGKNTTISERVSGVEAEGKTEKEAGVKTDVEGEGPLEGEKVQEADECREVVLCESYLIHTSRSSHSWNLVLTLSVFPFHSHSCPLFR